MIRPIKPIGPVICAFGAKAPSASPTKRTAPTPSEKLPMLIWPTRYPRPMARNAVRMGCVPMMSRARSIIGLPLLQKRALGPGAYKSAGTAAGSAKLLKHRLHQIWRGRRCLRKLVFEVHRFPFEGAELMKRLHFNPFHILHGRDKPCDAVDICRIVGQSGNQREAHPDRLSNRCQAFCEPQCWSQIAPGDRAIRVWIRALDV